MKKAVDLTRHKTFKQEPMLYTPLVFLLLSKRKDSYTRDGWIIYWTKFDVVWSKCCGRIRNKQFRHSGFWCLWRAQAHFLVMSALEAPPPRNATGSIDCLVLQ